MRSAHRILVELIVELFDLESRLFRTLKYLVMSIIFFFLLSTMANILPGNIDWKMIEDGKNVEIVCLSGSEIDLGESEIFAADSSVKLPASVEQKEWERVLEQKIKEVVADPSAGLAELTDNLPLMTFLLLPLYALLFQMFYFRNFYTQHLVFSIKLVMPDQDPGMIVSENTEWFADVWSSVKFALTIGSILYCYLALKRVYAQSYLRTRVKFLALALTLYYL